MDILDTLEARWFIDDRALADAARSWFASTPAEAKREDHYLVTGRDDLGFKARATRIETKYRLESLGAIPLGNGNIGDAERWRKLSLDVDDSAPEKQGTWVRVAKQRRQRIYAYHDNAVTLVTGNKHPDIGCGVELTEIEILGPGTRALTIGLEAFGSGPLFDVLRRVGEVGIPDLGLGLDRAASYPRWLSTAIG